MNTKIAKRAKRGRFRFFAVFAAFCEIILPSNGDSSGESGGARFEAGYGLEVRAPQIFYQKRKARILGEAGVVMQAQGRLGTEVVAGANVILGLVS